MTENEVGKVALHIEKEMFNLFHVTDNRYKSKYRSIMFNLKDPKNQVRVASPEAEGSRPRGVRVQQQQRHLCLWVMNVSHLTGLFRLCLCQCSLPG